ncbi:uncharacterized protein LOC119662758 [Teleopsis dalmanni]|uniref:uncharacterized protein LOC119662758 n=1 Tax=Teleopsis dalmanni TaxID=139649 RepID=UPI0018CF343E|nr:uncharacterized protein LOC119662758 [Teleopsis dalmanni]
MDNFFLRLGLIFLYMFLSLAHRLAMMIPILEFCMHLCEKRTADLYKRLHQLGEQRDSFYLHDDDMDFVEIAAKMRITAQYIETKGKIVELEEKYKKIAMAVKIFISILIYSFGSILMIYVCSQNNEKLKFKVNVVQPLQENVDVFPFA